MEECIDSLMKKIVLLCIFIIAVIFGIGFTCGLSVVHYLFAIAANLTVFVVIVAKISRSWYSFRTKADEDTVMEQATNAMTNCRILRWWADIQLFCRWAFKTQVDKSEMKS